MGNLVPRHFKRVYFEKKRNDFSVFKHVPFNATISKSQTITKY